MQTESDATRILRRAIAEPHYRELLLSDPEAAISGCQLNPRERALLTSFTRERLEALIGSMVAHWLLPLEVSAHFRLIPWWHEPPADDSRIIIRLGPDLAFGNGTHSTTILCLNLLDQHICPGDTLLDLGTGSGILAIAGARLGAASVLALDNDPGAVQSACENVRLNALSSIVQVRLGSLEDVPKGPLGTRFRIVTANILTPILVTMLEEGLTEVLQPGGLLILSGMRQSEVATIVQAAVQVGLSDPEHTHMGGWAALAYRIVDQGGEMASD